MKIAKVGLYIVLAGVGFAAWRYIIIQQPLRFGANEAPQTQNLGIVIYGYVVTLIGVLLGSVYRELQTRKERGESSIGNVSEFLKSVFLSLDMWMSLCGSPIVYALIWKSLDGGNTGGLTVIALQNGFCCTMLLSNLLKRGPNQNAAPAGH